MKKRINNSLVLLALCMQHAPGKIVAVEQVTMAEAYVKPMEKENITGRLMVLVDKVDRLDKPQLAKMYDSIDDLFELVHDKDEKSFTAKNLEDKQKHIKNKTQKLIKVFKSKPLTGKEVAEASKVLGSMENLFSKPKSKK